MGAFLNAKQGVSLLRYRKEVAVFPNFLGSVQAHSRVPFLRMASVYFGKYRKIIERIAGYRGKGWANSVRRILSARRRNVSCACERETLYSPVFLCPILSQEFYYNPTDGCSIEIEKRRAKKGAGPCRL